jgi:hypothetical protein
MSARPRLLRPAIFFATSVSKSDSITSLPNESPDWPSFGTVLRMLFIIIPMKIASKSFTAFWRRAFPFASRTGAFFPAGAGFVMFSAPFIR